ncbi:MAG TPA: hypothetical protein DCS07_10945 [Bdellovibrionales bacterium]|nr:MAG: hypothetical protein A2Z97_02270 [Bdellovibrionales bacterium GWB1_52_6]OFZ04089.1 MAG: hypothetical protein A2X97_14910 [Bdellovibrionales bacterium GWA1_52_35]OFZ41220.1 MAG: hypothetical protein A2070_03825 [Bdellovibrionales bacterium GWC1_52_8]HAR43125.1 hypothetical protein [Bdellovibrionales bacterium]HCM39824.1 hypothetical protein [Bdellovibrionales bacterium]
MALRILTHIAVIYFLTLNVGAYASDLWEVLFQNKCALETPGGRQIELKREAVVEDPKIDDATMTLSAHEGYTFRVERNRLYKDVFLFVSEIPGATFKYHFFLFRNTKRGPELAGYAGANSLADLEREIEWDSKKARVLCGSAKSKAHHRELSPAQGCKDVASCLKNIEKSRGSTSIRAHSVSDAKQKTSTSESVRSPEAKGSATGSTNAAR